MESRSDDTINPDQNDSSNSEIETETTRTINDDSLSNA